MMNPGEVTPATLWALLRTSPALARGAADQAGDFYPNPDRAFEQLDLRLDLEGGVVLALTACLAGEYAYHFVRAADVDIGPDAALREIVRRGLHLRAAAVRQALWKTQGRPISGSVVVFAAPEFDPYGRNCLADHAEYVLGDELERQGEAAYARSLGLLRDSAARGWPRWADRAPEVIDVRPAVAEPDQ